MKFDSEQVYTHATRNHRPDTKPFECDDNALDSTGFKSENNMVKDYQNGVLCASEAKERDEDGWAVTELDRSMSLNDLTNNNEKDVGDLTAPYSHSCREVESSDDSGFYMDKNVMECELPELIVCYKESTYHVKDICVDEGVPSQDNNAVESDINEKDIGILLPPKKDKISEPMEEKNKNDEPLPDVMKSSADKASNVDKVYKCDSSPDKGVNLFDSKDLMLTGKAKDDSTDKIANIVSEKTLSLADLLSIRDSVSEKPCFEFSTKTDTEVEKGSSECSSGKAVSGNPALVLTTGESNDDAEEAIAASSDFVSAAEESNNGSEKAILANAALNPAAEEKKDDRKEGTLTSSELVSTSEYSTESDNIDNLSYNSKVETGSITFDFDASAPNPKAKGTEDCPHNGDSAAPIENPDTSKLEDAPRQSVSSQAHGGLGESSFHVSGSLPSLISYSGPIAVSGNLSIRSDSSTTSTRSFAFPVLQSEWNSSPVRMAKADQRHLRKQKCWRQGLLCCRF